MIIKARKLRTTDLEVRVSWINNPLINQYMFFDLPATIERTKKWFNKVEKNSERIDFTFVDEYENIIAMGGLSPIDLINNNAEFYIMVNPDLHRKGIGVRVSQWIFNYGFLKYNLHKIYLYTNDDNIAGYSIYEKSNFILEGIQIEQKNKNNRYVNRRFYGLLRKNWEKTNWKLNNINSEVC